MPRIMRYAVVITIVVLALLILLVNSALARIVEGFAPGSALWTHLILLGLELIALLWLWRGFFGGRRHLSFAQARTEEERLAFVQALTGRLRQHPLLRELDPDSEDYLPQAITILNTAANQEIRRASERVFLASALSQNGRLDALIVFFSLCRMVWRVSAIYNQKPHPAEILSLYWTTISTTFIAFSFEELNIATEITTGFGQIFNSVAPTAATSGVPFVGAALQKFTASAIDGAANCFLTLRAGIITRNAYSYVLEGRKRPSRAAVFVEAGGMLMEMSSRIIGAFSKSLGRKLWKLTKAAPGKTLDLGLKAGIGTGKALVDGASLVGNGISAGVDKLATGAVKTAQGTAAATGVALDKVGNGLSQVAGGTKRGLRKAIHKTKQAFSGKKKDDT